MRSTFYALGFFFCIYSVLSETCLEEAKETQQCVRDVMNDVEKETDLDEANDKMKCSFLDGAVECARNYVESCDDMESKEAMQDIINDLEDQFAKDQCSILSEEEKEIIRCVSDNGKLEEYLGTCAIEAMENGDLESSDDDTKCEIFLATSKCTADKLGNSCGEEVAVPFFYGMMIALQKEAPEVAESPICKNVLEKLDDEYKDPDFKRKRRSLRKVHFRRFVSMI